MSGRRLDSTSEICPVCHEDVEIYSVGQCDHHVCYRCLTRMRVLCEQMYCPICRADIPKVIFITKLEEFHKVNTNRFLVNPRQKIYFENEIIRQAYFKLLEHQCEICKDKPPERGFYHLQNHMRRAHQKFYCDLCVSHLKMFTHERKFYSRQDLAVHRRQGDADDTSHRGHPLCEFCDERYLDNDELVCHLRKDHFYCHFCDADGSNEYFGDYNLLRKHYSELHFLCEEGDCIDAKFTNAFRTEIDLKAHKSTAHSKSMKKSAARQTRALDIQFNLAPRERNNRGKISSEDYVDLHEERSMGRGRGLSRQFREDGKAMGSSLQDVIAEKKQKQLETSACNTDSTSTDDDDSSDFVKNADNNEEPMSIEKDFPSLGACKDNEVYTTSAASNVSSSTMANSLALASGMSVGDQPQSKAQEEAFPVLGNPKKPFKGQPHPKQKVWTSPETTSNVDEYPSLPVSESSKSRTVNGSKTKESRKANAVTKISSPKPVKKTAPKVDIDDFPGLPTSKPKKDVKVNVTKPNKDFVKVNELKPKVESPKVVRKVEDDFPSLSKKTNLQNTGDSPSYIQSLQNNEINIKLQNTSHIVKNSQKKKEKVPQNYNVPPTVDDYPVLESARSNSTNIPETQATWIANKTPKGGKESVAKTSAVTMVNKEEDFPALFGGSLGEITDALWVKKTSKPRKEKPKVSAESHSAFDPIPGLVMTLNVGKARKEKTQLKNVIDDKKTKSKGTNGDSGYLSDEVKKAGNGGESVIQSSIKEENAIEKILDLNTGEKENTVTINSASQEGLNDIGQGQEVRNYNRGREGQNYNRGQGQESHNYGRGQGQEEIFDLAVEETVTENQEPDDWKLVKKGQGSTINKKERKKRKKKQKAEEAEEADNAEDDIVRDYLDVLENVDEATEVKEPEKEPEKETQSKKTKKKKSKSKKTESNAENKEEPAVSEEVTMATEDDDEKELNEKLVMLSIHDNVESHDSPAIDDNADENKIDIIIAPSFAEDDFPDLSIKPKLIKSMAAPLGLNTKQHTVPDFTPEFISLLPQLSDLKDISVGLLGKELTGPTRHRIPAPPPGFAKKSPAVKKTLPPGFQTKKVVIPQPPPGFEKPTPVKDQSSSVQNEMIPNIEYQYIEPLGVLERNKKLTDGIKEAGDKNFALFKQWSGMYRQNNLPASEYYVNCQEILRSDNFSNIFPELLTLLPDIVKQKELLDVHLALTRTRLMNNGKLNKKGGVANLSDAQFSQCQICSQVMFPDDMKYHLQCHVEGEDFPKLTAPSTGLFGMLNNWTKSLNF